MRRATSCNSGSAIAACRRETGQSKCRQAGVTPVREQGWDALGGRGFMGVASLGSGPARGSASEGAGPLGNGGGRVTSGRK